jgi:hypothetical protein
MEPWNPFDATSNTRINFPPDDLDQALRPGQGPTPPPDKPSIEISARYYPADIIIPALGSGVDVAVDAGSGWLDEALALQLQQDCQQWWDELAAAKRRKVRMA